MSQTHEGKRVALVAFNPDLVNYSNFPGLNAEKVRADLQQQQDILQGLGVEFHNFFLDPATFDSTEDLSQALQSRNFDVVVIGGGVRLPTENLLWFEKVVNLVHSKAPGAKISFNVGPDSTAEAVQRWL